MISLIHIKNNIQLHTPVTKTPDSSNSQLRGSKRPPGTRDIAVEIQLLEAAPELVPGDAVRVLGATGRDGEGVFEFSVERQGRDETEVKGTKTDKMLVSPRNTNLSSNRISQRITEKSHASRIQPGVMCDLCRHKPLQSSPWPSVGTAARRRGTSWSRRFRQALNGWPSRPLEWRRRSSALVTVVSTAAVAWSVWTIQMKRGRMVHLVPFCGVYLRFLPFLRSSQCPIGDSEVALASC